MSSWMWPRKVEARRFRQAEHHVQVLDGRTRLSLHQIVDVGEDAERPRPVVAGDRNDAAIPAADGGRSRRELRPLRFHERFAPVRGLVGGEDVRLFHAARKAAVQRGEDAPRRRHDLRREGDPHVLSRDGGEFAFDFHDVLVAGEAVGGDVVLPLGEMVGGGRFLAGAGNARTGSDRAGVG